MDNHKILLLHENFSIKASITHALMKKNKISITECDSIDDFLINLRDKKPKAVFIGETITCANEKIRAIFTHYYPDDSETQRGFSLIKYLRRNDLFPELSRLFIFFTTMSMDKNFSNEVNKVIGKNGAYWNLLSEKDIHVISKKIIKIIGGK